MMRKILIVILLGQLFSFETVKNLDIERFMGKWYVISAIPTFVEKGCSDAYDIYTLKEDDTIEIRYSAMNCNILKEGKVFNILQEGKIIDNINKSKWEVSFIDPWIPFYSAPYDILIIDDNNYEYVVVGSTLSFGWVLSRNKTMDQELYNDILNKLEIDFNYDKNKFKKMSHKNQIIN